MINEKILTDYTMNLGTIILAPFIYVDNRVKLPAEGKFFRVRVVDTPEDMLPMWRVIPIGYSNIPGTARVFVDGIHRTENGESSRQGFVEEPDTLFPGMYDEGGDREKKRGDRMVYDEVLKYIHVSNVSRIIGRLLDEKRKSAPSGLPLQYHWLTSDANPKAKEELFDEFISKLNSLTKEIDSLGLIPWDKAEPISKWAYDNKENNDHGLREWRRVICDMVRYLNGRKEASPEDISKLDIERVCSPSSRRD